MLHQSKLKHDRLTYCSQTLNPQMQMLPPPENFQIDNDYIFIQATKVKQKLKKINTKNYETLYNSFKYSSIDNYEKEQKNKNRHNLSLNVKDMDDKSQKQTKSLYIQQGKLLKKVTIHRIRSQRDSIQNQTKMIENKFHYITQAIAKRQKIQKLKYQKLCQINKIRTQKIRKRQMCSKQKEQSEKNIIKHKIELKQSVVRQKIKAQESVKNITTKNWLKALQLKQESQKNQLIILQRQKQLVQRNKIMYEAQKEQQKIRSQIHKHNLDSKRIQARQRFKQKWLNQYQKNNKSRQHYKKQKNEIQLKLKSVLTKYETGELVDICQKKQKNCKNCKIGWSKQPKKNLYENTYCGKNNTEKKIRTSFFEDLE